MNRTCDTYKDILNINEKNLEEIQNKVDCLEQSQVYVHWHCSRIASVEQKKQ